MKLVCEVTAVKADGELLTITMQGGAKRDAQWRRMGAHTIQIAETPQSQRTFHLGRKVTLTVKP